MIEFRKTEDLKIEIKSEQACNLSAKSKIEKMLKEKNVFGFDIYMDDILIGFAMLKKFGKNKYFLWDYLIDYKFQNKGIGTQALGELINLLKKQYDCKVVTTTYKFGNTPAKHLYEKLGFVETDIVDEDDVHEVNMKLKL